MFSFVKNHEYGHVFLCKKSRIGLCFPLKKRERERPEGELSERAKERAKRQLRGG